MRSISKFILTLAVVALLPMVANAQAKKPTLMVVPADAWCVENGYMAHFNNQGVQQDVPEYQKALQNDMDLLNVITKVGALMADRQFPLKDLAATLRTINQNDAEDAMTVSKSSGATLAETPLERLMNRAKADIIIEVAWKINKQGPKKSVTYTLRGLDAYTNKQVAAAQGTGKPSFNSEVPVLLEEAVLENMDSFVAQLQAHFDDLFANGREVSFNLRIFDNGSGLSFEDEYDGTELTEIVENWMAENTVNHRFNLSDASENRMLFEQVRIPLYRTNGMPMDTRTFITGLRKFLAKPPYNIQSKIITKGLGRADLILGEK